MKIERYISVFLIFAISLTLFAGCSTSENKPVIEGTVMKFNEFGAAELDISAESFSNAGFEFGDTVNVYIAGERIAENAPYYNGYYAKEGDVIIVAYPGEENIIISASQKSFKEAFDYVRVGDSVRIEMHEKHGASNVQEALNLVYSNNREDFSSDEVFANFREIKLGEIGSGKLYRSASPCDNKYNRASYANALAEKHGIQAVLNLSDNAIDLLKRYSNGQIESEYYKQLIAQRNVVADVMSTDFGNELGFKKTLASMLVRLAFSEGPYLIHCVEGKDRTGFVCTLLEALMGATYEEMRDDYMLKYKNYYNVDEASAKEQYDLIVEIKFDDYIQKDIVGDQTVDIKNCDLKEYAYQYLISAGLTREFVDYFAGTLR